MMKTLFGMIAIIAAILTPALLEYLFDKYLANTLPPVIEEEPILYTDAELWTFNK